MNNLFNKQNRFLSIVVFFLLLSVGCITAAAQEWRLSPLQQTTIMTYAGKDARPLVPVAMLNTRLPNGLIAANQLATQRNEKLQYYSLHPQAENFTGADTTALNRIFEKALNDTAVLYFEDCAYRFNDGQPKPEDALYQQHFLQRIKMHKGALLLQCNSKTSWYRLAKAGCGMVSLD